MNKLNCNKQSLKQNGSVPNQILVIIVTFFVGYLSASFLDIATISQWATKKISPSQLNQATSEPVSAQVSPKHKFEFYTLLTNEKTETNSNTANANPNANAQTQGSASNAAAIAAANTVAHQAPATNPSNAQIQNNVQVPRHATVMAPAAQQPIKPATVVVAKPLPESTKNFTVQVASFRERKDAEHMKGLLTLKGFSVFVVAISQPSGNWYRVLVGPYPNRILAQRAQEHLARNERIRGMISST